jgi:hypothetical protein
MKNTDKQALAQKMFNIIVLGLSKQGRKSMDVNELCMYRGIKGRKCGIGFIITDENYNKNLENKGADSPKVMKAAHSSLDTGISFESFVKLFTEFLVYMKSLENLK